MRIKKWIFIIIALVGAILLCGFVLVPSVRLSSGEHIVNVSYRNAQVKSDTLFISVDYKSNGATFEIGKDIVVAIDEDFSNTLQLKRCNTSDGLYTYEYDINNINQLDTVYIKPPILYMPIGIETVSVGLYEGATATINKSDDVSNSIFNANWFTIEFVEASAWSDNIYEVHVGIKALDQDLPRFPKLTIDGAQYGGISSLIFDRNSNFDCGEFIFYVNADSENQVLEMLSHASLKVDNALVKVEAKSLNISSNVKNLSVVDTNDQ